MGKEKKKGCGCSTILVGLLCFLCFAMIFGNTKKDDSDQPAAKQTSSSVQAAATSTPRKSASPTQKPTATPVPTVDSGPKGRGFESRHFDQKPLHGKGFLFCFAAIRARYE